MPEKPAKPRPDFPLFAHACGQWAKKIRGKIRYFGSWADHQAALEKYVAQRDEWQAGRTPRTGVGITVGDLCNHFLVFKKSQVKSRDLTERTWSEYKTTCERLIRVFGRGTPCDSLAPHDFAELRADIAKTRNAVALTTEVQRCRTVFKFGDEERYLERAVNMGKNFVRAKKVAVRRERNSRPSKLFTPAELRALIYGALVPHKPMILLGINAAFGQTDLSELDIASVDLDGGWITFPRPKTEIARRCPLWPETVHAMREALQSRYKPSHCPPDRFFVSRKGYPMVWFKPDKGGRIDSVGQFFRALLLDIGIKRPGVSFYALRHTFRTIADETLDTPAIKRIMGHSDEDEDDEMRGNYVETIADERMIAVSEYVRRWLFFGKWAPAQFSPTRKKPLLFLTRANKHLHYTWKVKH